MAVVALAVPAGVAQVPPPPDGGADPPLRLEAPPAVDQPAVLALDGAALAPAAAGLALGGRLADVAVAAVEVAVEALIDGSLRAAGSTLVLFGHFRCLPKGGVPTLFDE